MAYGAGVDVGSTQTKAIIIDEARQIVHGALESSRVNLRQAQPRSD